MNEPAITELVITELVITELVITEPAITEPAIVGRFARRRRSTSVARRVVGLGGGVVGSVGGDRFVFGRLGPSWTTPAMV